MFCSITRTTRPRCKAICNFISRWPTGRAVGVLGLPGDRADSLLEQSARVAGCGLGTVILREDKDLSGRKPGEVPEMMQRVIASSYPDLPVEIVPDELDAITTSSGTREPGDVIVIFVEKVAEAVEMFDGLGRVACYRRGPSFAAQWRGHSNEVKACAI
jgi:cyanophycin synthetase